MGAGGLRVLLNRSLDKRQKEAAADEGGVAAQIAVVAGCPSWCCGTLPETLFGTPGKGQKIQKTFHWSACFFGFTYETYINITHS